MDSLLQLAIIAENDFLIKMVGVDKHAISLSNAPVQHNNTILQSHRKVNIVLIKNMQISLDDNVTLRIITIINLTKSIV